MTRNAKALIASLNEDLAGELGAIIQYLTYAAKATGPYRPQLAQLFLAEVADEQTGDRERREARHERLAQPEHVPAALDRADGGT